MELLILFFVGIIGFFFGWHAREMYAMRVVKSIMEQANMMQEAQEEENPRTPMRLEVHNNTIFAYSEVDGSFIAQGVDLEGLDKAIQSRFPDKKFSVKEKNLLEISGEVNDPI